MGVIQKKLYVDGINLANYGLYITGQSAFNAPQRDVELVSIPGRNGDYIIDNGRFQNIEVTYPAGLREDVTDFATRVAEIRNILASRHRYVRIEDDYNPDEYREGMFVSGLEVTPACDNIAGQFDLVFNCKPQRFLKSGETAVSVASGGTITNPTAFESKPLIEVFGYGLITVNGYPITIQDTVLGRITLANAQTSDTGVIQFSSGALNVGDTITLEPSTIRVAFTSTKAVDALTVTTSGTLSTTASAEFEVGGDQVVVNIDVAQQTYSNGTSNSKTGTITINATYADSTTETGNLYLGLIYDPSNDRISTTISMSGGVWPLDYIYVDYSFGKLTGNSTKHSTGNPLYIDCEMGDAYKIEDGEMIFLNKYISMPNDLPVLASGSNAVSYDNTITSFKITPRWWQI